MVYQAVAARKLSGYRIDLGRVRFWPAIPVFEVARTLFVSTLAVHDKACYPCLRGSKYRTMLYDELCPCADIDTILMF